MPANYTKMIGYTVFMVTAASP